MSIVKKWNRIRAEADSDLVGVSLKERFLAKIGKATSNTDLAVSSRTEIEAKRLLEYCAAPNSLTSQCYAEPLNVDKDKSPERHDGKNGSTPRLAGVTKRGMPQPKLFVTYHVA